MRLWRCSCEAKTICSPGRNFVQRVGGVVSNAIEHFIPTVTSTICSGIFLFCSSRAFLFLRPVKKQNFGRRGGFPAVSIIRNSVVYLVSTLTTASISYNNVWLWSSVLSYESSHLSVVSSPAVVARRALQVRGNASVGEKMRCSSRWTEENTPSVCFSTFFPLSHYEKRLWCHVQIELLCYILICSCLR